MPEPIIIDTDPGVDDALALLLAFACPELDVVGIVVTFGNCDAKTGMLNTLKILGAVSRHVTEHPEQAARFPSFREGKRIPLLHGADMPVQGPLLSAKYFHGKDGLRGISELYPSLIGIPETSTHIQPVDRPYTDVVLELVQQYSGKLTYCALGPMTSLYHIRQSAQSRSIPFDDQIGRVVAMGGALDVPGNTSPTAEFNIFADPFAARSVIRSQLAKSGKLVLLPLDITTSHVMPFDIYQQKVDAQFGSNSLEGKSPLAAFTSAWLEQLCTFLKSMGIVAMELHDPLVIAYVAENAIGKDSSQWTVMMRAFDIETQGELTRGMCVVDRRGIGESGKNRAEEGAINAKSINSEGVMTLVKTSGSESVCQLVMSRIWGCS